MILFFSPQADAGRHAPLADALKEWYDAHPRVLRLWAIESTTAGSQPAQRALRVVITLGPSADGDETSPAWMAHGPRWALDLQQRLDRQVHLECMDGLFADSIEIDGEGRLVAALYWRDATVAAD